MRFDGINEKLKRTDENIRNLTVEIMVFIKKSEYPVMPKIDSEEHGKALQYFKTLRIPLRFSVLAGEIVHHLRSCMDHIIWELSDDATRNSDDGRYLEFPILETRPTSENKFTRYERKIKGVIHIGALKFIEELQPYNRVSVTTDPLWLIQKMDIIDKHRELIFTHSTGYIEGPPDLMMQMSAHLARKAPMPAALKRELDKHCQITPQVSFRDLPGREAEPIIPVLTELTGYVKIVLMQFGQILI